MPGHANGYYINDILKGELGFDGFTVSDWEVNFNSFVGD
jgi:beta-glucosidase